MLDRLRASSEPLDCVIVGAGVQGRAHARTVVDVLEGVREVSVTFISRSELADLPHPWVESGSAEADEVLGRAGLVVVATSAGEPVVVDRQLRPDATVLAVGAHTVGTRELGGRYEETVACRWYRCCCVHVRCCSCCFGRASCGWGREARRSLLRSQPRVRAHRRRLTL